jgi:hypothetical protein
MSTITKEQAHTISDLKAGYTLGHADVAILNELARIALASLEAEPVAYQYRFRWPGVDWRPWEACGKAVFDIADSEGCDPTVGRECEVMALYTTPPAHVVPDEHYQQLSDLYHSQEKRLFKIAQRIMGPSFDKYAHSPSQVIDVLESALFGESADADRASNRGKQVD